MDAVVAPLLHNNEPVKFEAANIEFPQLSLTVTVGADGIDIGEAVPLAGALVHPLGIVCVTLYVPPVNTVIDWVDNPSSLHSKVPA